MTVNRIKASGVAKRLARERGLSLATLSGTGPGGRILGADVLRHLEAGAVSHQSSVISREPHRRQEPAPTHHSPRTQDPGPRTPQHPTPNTQHLRPRPGRRLPFAGARRIIAERMHQSARETASVTLVAELDVTEAVRL
jgi:pyruvate dehydrogenase E2 component (dihydrolipoamide acetyltransferase)